MFIISYFYKRDIMYYYYNINSKSFISLLYAINKAGARCLVIL